MAIITATDLARCAKLHAAPLNCSCCSPRCNVHNVPDVERIYKATREQCVCLRFNGYYHLRCDGPLSVEYALAEMTA